LTKDSATCTLKGYQHQLNSYAFYSKHLINSVGRFLPYNYEKLQIEDIFIEKFTRDLEKKDIIPQRNAPEADRIRKRCLISSDFKTAY
jgi:hypothetical protein